MGEKAGTTAHELRNPLGVIATSMSVIEYKARQVELDLANPVDRAKRAICRCEHIIDEHLDAARAQGHRPVRTSCSRHTSIPCFPKAPTCR